MSRYYIIDFLGDEEEVFETTEKDFYEQMEENYSVARENGDSVPGHKQMMKNFRNRQNHEEAFNAFSFLKLTTKTIEEWGY